MDYETKYKTGKGLTIAIGIVYIIAVIGYLNPAYLILCPFLSPGAYFAFYLAEYAEFNYRDRKNIFRTDTVHMSKRLYFPS